MHITYRKKARTRSQSVRCISPSVAAPSLYIGLGAGRTDRQSIMSPPTPSVRTQPESSLRLWIIYLIVGEGGTRNTAYRSIYWIDRPTIDGWMSVEGESSTLNISRLWQYETISISVSKNERPAQGREHELDPRKKVGPTEQIRHPLCLLNW